MAIGKNPQLYISDPVYETTLEPPTLAAAEFVYIGYTPDEMTSEQPGTDTLQLFAFGTNPPPVLYRYVRLNWDFKRRQNMELNGTTVIQANMGSMDLIQARATVDATKFFLNRSLQLILEDTNPEVRLDPRRFQLEEFSNQDTEIKQQFSTALKDKLDLQEDDPDDVELFSAYIDSMKEIMGPTAVAQLLDSVMGYLRDSVTSDNSEQSTEETQSFNSPRSSIKFKIGLSTKFAPSLISSAITTQGPFALELTDVKEEARRKKISFSDVTSDASEFAFDVSSQNTKDEIYQSFNRLTPTIDNLIRTVSLLFTGQVLDPSDAEAADNDDVIIDAYQELFESDPNTINITSAETQDVLNQVADRIGGDLFPTLGTLVSDLVQPVGFRVNRKELRPNLDGTVSVHVADPLFVLDSTLNQKRDTRIRYGSVYEFSVSTVYRIIVPFIGEGGELLKKTVFVASEASNTIRVTAEDFSPVATVPGVELEEMRKDDGSPDGVRLSWDHPPDIKGKIRGFRVYRRAGNLKSAYRLLREFQFRRPPTTHTLFYRHELDAARALSPNGPLVDLTETIDKPGYPKRHFEDISFRNDNEYVYTVTAVDIHGNESACSDQLTLSFGNGQRMVSLRGAPLDYPNLYIDRRQILDTKIAKSIRRSRTKAVIFFDPVAKTIAGEMGYRGQSMTVGNHSSDTSVFAASLLENNMQAFDAPVQLDAGRTETGEEDGTHAFIFTAEGSILFDGISGEYDFIVFDENNLKTAIVRTVIKYGSDSDVTAELL